MDKIIQAIQATELIPFLIGAFFGIGIMAIANASNDKIYSKEELNEAVEKAKHGKDS